MLPRRAYKISKKHVKKKPKADPCTDVVFFFSTASKSYQSKFSYYSCVTYHLLFTPLLFYILYCGLIELYCTNQ